MRLAAFCTIILLSAAPVPGNAQPAPGAGYHLDAHDLEKFRALSPAERNAAVNQAQEQLQKMNDSDRRALVEQARGTFDALSPAEQEQLKGEALQRWQAMTPEEQQQLRASFPGLQGEPQ